MATIKDQHNPSFARLAIATNRTAWRPLGLPVILVAPHIRDEFGRSIPSSQIIQVKIYIAEAGSTRVPVAGHDHVGVFYPDTELLTRILAPQDLYSRKITLNMVEWLDALGNQLGEGTSSGSAFKFACRSGIVDTLPFIDGADYYDLSDITINVEDLPNGHYTLVYEVQYYTRVVSDTGKLICIRDTVEVFTRFRFPFNHPGEVLLQMVEGTPDVYFTGSKLSTDTTVAFYRPLAEAMQDVFDEQGLLKMVNWVYETPAEYIPYLGFILGWDIPYFPDSVDALRRAMIRNTVRLQKLKGSKRAVRELFDLFGFAATIHNVWWTPDGKAYLAPGETAKVDGGLKKINIIPTVTTEPLLASYDSPGYGKLSIPLINRPTPQTVVIDLITTTIDTLASAAAVIVQSHLSDDIGYYDIDLPITKIITTPQAITNLSLTSGIVDHNRVTIDEAGIATVVVLVGSKLVSSESISVDYNVNVVSLSFSRYVDFAGYVAHAFASYPYNRLDIPADMVELQSNRFDVELVDRNGDEVRSDVIIFLLDYLFKIKAFHSLLRKLIYTITAHDTYLVTDLCVGGDITQRLDVDAGKQQVPPEAIIPHAVTDLCDTVDPTKAGYRPQDLAYRKIILADLVREFEAWKVLAPDCALNYKGQDRITETREQLEAHNHGTTKLSTIRRGTLCVLTGADYCYQGRVDDAVELAPVIPLAERWSFQSCGTMFGVGTYYLYPAPYLAGDIKLKYGGMLGELLRNYNERATLNLHFVDDGLLDSDQRRHLAWRRPPVNIQKDNFNFPGHRLPTFNALDDDFTHLTYKLKPWDIEVVCGCPPQVPDTLHALLVVGSDGDDYLVYDDTPYVIAGNGLIPDVSSFGDHAVGSGVSASDVTHAIYLDQASGHLSITDDGDFVQAIGTIEVSEPLFTSAASCGSVVLDYSDGYPAVTGFLDPHDFGSGVLFDFVGASDSDELMAELGVPVFVAPSQLLFRWSSEIRVHPVDAEFQFYKPMRFDCGCGKVSCGGGSSGESVANAARLLQCSIGQFIDLYGNFDPDQLEVDQKLVLVETQRCVSQLFNDPLSSLFKLITGVGGLPYQPIGSLIFKDEYDQIYEVQWEKIGNFLDFITVTKEPRVWGISDHGGVIRNRERFSHGIVTIDRLVYQLIDGSYVQIASGMEQYIDDFQSTYLCRPPFADPFSVHFDCNLYDGLEGEVTAGVHWTDGESSSGSEWSDYVTGVGDLLVWVDVFGV